MPQSCELTLCVVSIRVKSKFHDDDGDGGSDATTAPVQVYTSHSYYYLAKQSYC